MAKRAAPTELRDARPAKRAKLDKSYSFTVWPKDGKWTLRAMHAIMTACEAIDDLKGVAPLWRVQGGFQWTSDVDVNDDRKTPQARTGVKSAWFTETKETWSSSFLDRKDVDTPMTPYNGAQQFDIYSFNGTSVERMKLLAQVFEQCGHVVARPRGFRFTSTYDNTKSPASGDMYMCGKCGGHKIHHGGKMYQAHYAFRLVALEQ